MYIHEKFKILKHLLKNKIHQIRYKPNKGQTRKINQKSIQNQKKAYIHASCLASTILVLSRQRPLVMADSPSLATLATLN